MLLDERARIEPAAGVFPIAGADKGSAEFAHLEMEMSKVAAMGRAHSGDLLSALHSVSGVHQNGFNMSVVRLHISARALFQIGVQDDDDVAPARSAFAGEQHAPVGHGVDRVAQVAVLAADPVEIVSQMPVLRETLGAISHRAMLTAEREIETPRRRNRCHLKGRRQLKGEADMPRPGQFRPESKKKRSGRGHQKCRQHEESEDQSSVAPFWLRLYARTMRILVTGGAGFIGSHLVEKLLGGGDQVAILDDFNDYYDPRIKHENISSFARDVAVHQVDLRDAADVRNLFHREKFEVIVHLAARAGVRPSIARPQLYYDTNVAGTLHLLEAARMTGVGRVVFASSSSVYGLCPTVPFSEDFHLTQTISPYAATKIAGEFLCSTYAHLYQMRIVALRYFTVYGPRQRPDLAIHQFTRRIQAGQSIDQFGDGTTRRDYTYIDDIIQGTTAALRYEGPLFDIFNLGESETIPLRDLIVAIETALGQKAKIRQLPEQPGDVPLTCADISKAKKLLGYQPQTRFKEGLPKFMQWFLGSAASRAV